MTSIPIPRWQAITVLVSVLVAVIAAVASIASTPRPSHTPACALSPCSMSHGGLVYKTQVFQIPASGTGSGPLTRISFGGIPFALWPVSDNALHELQGTALEPGGLRLAFVVWADNSSVGGNPPPTNETVRTWYAPDGEIGVYWVSYGVQSDSVRLAVSSPSLVYAEKNVTLNRSALSAGPPTTFSFLEYNFTISIYGWPSPAGPSLDANVVGPNGSTVQLGLWAGPPVCTIGDAPPSMLANATCLETAADNHTVGLVWDGYLGVKLLVRTA